MTSADQDRDQIADRTTKGPAFAMVLSGVLDSPEFASLTSTAIRVYLQIARFANRETDQAFPARATIARNARILVHATGEPDVGQVRKALRRLSSVGLLTTQTRKGTSGRSTSNLYVLTDPPSFVGYESTKDRHGRIQIAPVYDLSRVPAAAGGPGRPPLRVVSNPPGGAVRPPDGVQADPLELPLRGVHTDPPRTDTPNLQGEQTTGTEGRTSGRGAWRGRTANGEQRDGRDAWKT